MIEKTHFTYANIEFLYEDETFDMKRSQLYKHLNAKKYDGVDKMF